MLDKALETNSTQCFPFIMYKERLKQIEKELAKNPSKLVEELLTNERIELLITLKKNRNK